MDKVKIESYISALEDVINELKCSDCVGLDNCHDINMPCRLCKLNELKRDLKSNIMFNN